MTTHLALPTVTALLKDTLQEVVNNVVAEAVVTTQRPDDKGSQKEARVNLFLYMVSPNEAFRGVDVPTRRSDGTLVERPRLGLDLHYLFTFTGDESELVPQQLLGSVSSALHAFPIIGCRRIRSFIEQTQDEEHQWHALAASRLGEQGESIRFTPITLNLEELSKLWSVFFQIPYAISTAYKASVVILEEELPARRALPVQRRIIRTTAAFAPISVASVLGRDGAEIFTGSTIEIRGHGFRGPGLSVRIDGTDHGVEPASGEHLFVDLTSLNLRPGIHPLCVRHATGAESNTVPFVLQPQVESVTAVDVTGSDDGPRSATIELELDATVGRVQKVILLLNELGVAAPAAFSFSVVGAREADGTSLAIPVTGVPAATYLVRVRIDGAESPVAAAGAPADLRYTDPSVVIP